jgi:hypothetical protein
VLRAPAEQTKVATVLGIFPLFFFSFLVFLGRVHLIQRSPSPTPFHFLKIKYKYKWRKIINWKKN